VCLALSLFFSLPASLFGATCFAPPIEIETEMRGAGIVVGDLNNDGFPDFIVSDCGTGSAGTVYLGRGDGTFRHGRMKTFSRCASSLALADFNHDGNLDLAAAQGSAAGVLLGNGDGTFQAEKHYPSGDVAYSVAVGDFNNDGNPDMLVDDHFLGTHYFFAGNGDGTFQAGKRIPKTLGDSSSQWSTAADFNADGNLDFVFLGTSLVLSLGNGDGTFGKHFSYPGGFFTVGDLNLDQIPDIVVVSAGGNNSQMTVLLGNGDGSMSALAPLPTPNQIYPAIGDLNQDGIPDVALGNLHFPNISIMYGTGDGTFQNRLLVNTKVTEQVKLADFNQDGLVDILTWTRGDVRDGVNIMLSTGECQGF
jgi:hypothetical protein